jgi:hypothetical protein
LATAARAALATSEFGQMVNRWMFFCLLGVVYNWRSFGVFLITFSGSINGSKDLLTISALSAQTREKIQQQTNKQKSYGI